MAEAGYGIYSGVGGLPYQVGQSPSYQQGGGYPISPVENREKDAQGGMPMPKPTQTQSAPGSAGSQGYMSQLPQWMQDYFDKQYGQNLGMFAENAQRNLAVNTLPGLQQKYGSRAAANPYFLGTGLYEKGVDVFGKNLEMTNDDYFGAYDSGEGYGPREGRKITRTTRDPFSGEQIGDQQVDYNYTPHDNSAHANQGGYNKLGRWLFE